MKTNKLQKHGLLLAASLNSDIAAAYGPLLTAQVNEDLAPLLDRVSGKLAEINGSDRLTERGKMDEMQRIGAEALAQIDKLHANRRGKIESDLRKLNLPSRLPTMAELAAQRKSDPVLLYLQLREIREALAKVDPVLHHSTLIDAARSGDLDVLVAAFDGHPLTRPAHFKELQREATAAYLDARLPESAKVSKSALMLFDSNAESTRKMIAKECNLNPFRNDAIQQAATAKPAAA